MVGKSSRQSGPRELGSLTLRVRLGEWTERAAPTLLPAPAVLLLIVMLGFPLVFTLYLSVHDWSLSATASPKFIGLANYTTLLLSDERFLQAAIRTLVFSAGTVSLQLLLGLALALALHRPFRGRGVARTLLTLPMVATPVAIAVVWAWLFEPTYGLLNQILGAIGVPPVPWLASPGTAMTSLVIVDTWHWTPLVSLILLAGLSSLPGEIFESARVDGATGWKSFWLITLPLLRPTLVVAALFRIIDALRIFDIIYALTDGGPGRATEVLNILVYHTSFAYYRMGYVSAMLVLFVGLILLISLALIKARRSEA